MHHAVGAFFIPPRAVVLPVGSLHQLAERFHITVLQKIAGSLPSEYVIRGISPRRALIFTPAHQEIQKERRLIEAPAPLAIAEDLRKQLFCPAALEKVLLIRSLLIAVAGGNYHPLDTELHHGVKKRPHPLWIGIIEQRGIGRHAMA